MSLLGRKLNNPKFQPQAEIPVAEGYGVEEFGHVTMQEDAFMDQLSILESFHEIDSIEDGFVADSMVMESSMMDEEARKEREAVFEADFKKAVNGAMGKLKGTVDKIAGKVKAVFNSIINFLTANFTSAKKLVEKHGSRIKGQSVEMECFEYGDITLDNPAFKALNAKTITFTLNSIIGGSLESKAKGTPEQMDEAKSKLAELKGKLGQFDRKEIVKALHKGADKPAKRTISGDHALGVVQNVAVIKSMKDQINAFQKEANAVKSQIESAAKAQTTSENKAAVASLVNSYMSAFSARCNAMVKTANIVKEVAVEHRNVMVKACRKILVKVGAPAAKKEDGAAEEDK